MMEKLLLLCFMLMTSMLNAQSEENIATIYLNNGEVYKGNMVDYRKGEYLVLKRLNGTLDTIPDNDIQRIEQIQMDIKPVKKASVQKRVPQVVQKPAPKKKRKYLFRETGWYNATGFSGFGGRSGSYLKMGIGISTTTGYMFNRMVGIGLGIGKDNYSSRQGEGLFPVYGEVRGYLKKKSNTPFYAIKAGYGMAFANEKFGITQAEGGLMLNPSVGYRFGGDKTGNIYFEMGYKFQKQFIEKTSTFNSDITVVDAIYNRISLSAGIIF
ncbi:MAG: hypothetical protein KDC85_20420 [Saprospiraceae bacterium]|nr:hypothetical protein [Saprospiraceae bacterium]MCB9322743.1 hypothetical protein [Lewinellaceae bacterium]